MIHSNGGSAPALARQIENEDIDPATGKKVMRMPQKPGQQHQRRTLQPSELIASLWEKNDAKMRESWLQIYCSVIASSAGQDVTANELAQIADEAYFEFHARSNPSKYSTTG